VLGFDMALSEVDEVETHEGRVPRTESHANLVPSRNRRQAP
jgi:hypothetical protein